MRIIEKYILRSYLVSVVFCLLLLVVVGVVGDILGFLDDIFKNNIPLDSILKFYLYFAPFAFVNMVPFSCLLAAVFVFNNLSKNHEISAIITSGISLWDLMKPVLVATFMICLITFIVNETVVPASMEKANRIRQEKLESSDEKQQVIKNMAVYGKGDQIIFAKEYSKADKRMDSVIIHKQNKSQVVVQKINARTVKWRDDGYWLGKDVLVFNLADNGDFSLDPQYYETRKMPILEKPGDFANAQWDPKMMSYRKLKAYIKILGHNSPTTVRRFLVDLHYKLAFPFAALVIILVGIPFSITTGRV
ncbi:MAG TPA: LptF/LptG family permease, partial [Candidatus Omnitrophota bacterium]|nr:LptF/LptG family permease [Candidatus Omnitrophota bacterium]